MGPDAERPRGNRTETVEYRDAGQDYTGYGLFMSLFDSWDGEYVLPVVASLSGTMPQTEGEQRDE